MRPSFSDYGFNVRPAAYRNADTGAQGAHAELPAIVLHTFEANADGCLEHFMDGRLCATVPPAGLHEYVEIWPAAKTIADILLGSKAGALVGAAGAIVGAVKAAKKKTAKARRR